MHSAAMERAVRAREGVMKSVHKRAFTLIELLVVIAVIALLAAVLFPVFAEARAKGRQAACLSNLRQFGISHTLYANDNRYVVLETRETAGAYRHPPTVTMRNVTGVSYYTWEALGPYIPGVNVTATSTTFSHKRNARRLMMSAKAPAGRDSRKIGSVAKAP